MRSIFPFFWRPTGVVSSLAELPVSDKVLAKRDVSISVSGEKSDEHPLLVAELAGGKIIGDLRLAATCDDVVVGGIQLVTGCKNLCDLKKHYALRRRRFRIPKYRRGTALMLGAANGDNYYHWLLETLPRWKMLQAAGYQQYDYVLLHSRPRRYQEETLDRLKVPPAKILRPSKNFIHQFERLIVPAMPFPLRQITPWACEWLRSLFPDRSGGPEKIYLTRRGVQRRQLVNELELEAQLQTLGFVSAQPEKLSVVEQARLFGSAKCVIASHGAGLANMAFAPANTLLIELFHPDILRPTYKNLAAACGLRYAAIHGQRTGDPSQTDDRWMKFQINVSKALQILAENI